MRKFLLILIIAGILKAGWIIKFEEVKKKRFGYNTLRIKKEILEE